LFFYLSRHPEVYRKLAKEIRSTFANASDIQGGPQLSGCKYLRACINESLRMTPPVSGTLWREHDRNDKQPFVVDGHVIPPGTQVGVSIYCIHHNEKYFPQPFDFSPERWLVDDEAVLRRMNSAFCPFSVGARACAGKAMAYLEMSLVVAKTFFKFDFEVPPGDLGQVGAGQAGRTDGRDRTDEFQLYDIFAAMHDGPNLLFRPRGGV
jgi:cytochrome P450